MTGERIAAVQGTSHARMAKQLFGACEIVEAENYDEAVELVKTGEVFGFFCGELEFYSQYLATYGRLTVADVQERYRSHYP